jgi:hypothetical protein
MHINPIFRKDNKNQMVLPLRFHPYNVCPPMNSRKMEVGGMASISEGCHVGEELEKAHGLGVGRGIKIFVPSRAGRITHFSQENALYVQNTPGQ